MSVRIGILDSGVLTNHEALSEYNIKGFSGRSPDRKGDTK